MRIKKLLAVLLAACMVFSLLPMSVFAEEAQEEEIYEETVAAAQEEPDDASENTDKVPQEENTAGVPEGEKGDAAADEESNANAEEAIEGIIEATEAETIDEPATAVAQIGDDTYATLEDALSKVIADYAATPVTITMLADYTTSSQLALRKAGDGASDVANYNLTIDLAGHSLTNGTTKNLFLLNPQGSLTITGNGAINAGGKYIASMNDGADSLVILNGAFADITEGVFSGLAKGNAKIYGGSFNVDPSAFVSSGYEAVQNGETWTVAKAKEASVTVNGTTTNYDTLSEAAAAAIAAGVSNVTITLLEDISISAQIALRIDKNDTTTRNIVLDLNGKTLTSSYASGLTIINKNTTLTIKNGSYNVTSSSRSYLVSANSGSTLIIESGTYTARNFEKITNGSGTVKIYGGTFGIEPAASCIPTGYKVTDNDDGTYTVSEVFEASVTVGENTTQYRTLNDAAAAAIAEGVSDATITLLEDVSISAQIALRIDKNDTTTRNIVLDLNGKTLTSSYASGLTVINRNTTLTVKNGSYNVTSTNNSYLVSANSGSKLIIESGTYTAANFEKITNGGGTVEIYGGTFGIEPAASYIPEGYRVTANADNTYTVSEIQAASVTAGGETVIYNTLEKAVAAAVASEAATVEVTLLEDCSIASRLEIDRNGEAIQFVLNLNGKTLTVAGTKGFAITRAGASLEITGTGNIELSENSYYFYANDASMVLIEGGVFTTAAESKAFMPGEGSTNPAKGKVVVSGGKFDTPVPEKYCTAGYEPAGPDTEGFYSVAAVQDESHYVAALSHGETTANYISLEAALSAATNGDTVTLLQAVTAASVKVPEGAVLDLNGKTLSADPATINNKGTIVVYDATTAGALLAAVPGTIRAGTALQVALTDSTGYGIPAQTTISVIPNEVESMATTVAVVLPSGETIINTYGVEAKKNMTVDGSIQLAGNICRGSRDDTNLTVSGNVTVIGDLAIGSDSTDANIDYVTYPDGKATLTVNGEFVIANGTLSLTESGVLVVATQLTAEQKAAIEIPDNCELLETAGEGCCTYSVQKHAKVTVTVTSGTATGSATVSAVTGGGEYEYGADVTVTANAVSGYSFVGWYVSTDGTNFTAVEGATSLSYSFKATESATYKAVFAGVSSLNLTVSADKFTVNGSTQRATYSERLPAGTQIILEYSGDGEFMYWTNESGKIMSTSANYSFTLVTGVSLYAYYKVSDVGENEAYVIFTSGSEQVLAARYYSSAESIAFPSAPAKMGKQFTGWSKTEAEIKELMTTESTIIVEPLFTAAEGTYTVTVSYVFLDNSYTRDDEEGQVFSLGGQYSVSAPEINGYEFNYWKVNNTIVSYSTSFSSYASKDVDITAVYDKNAVEAQAAVALTQLDKDMNGDYPRIKMTMNYVVPSGYMVTGAGYVRTDDSSNASPEMLVLENVNGSTIKNSVSTNLNGTYVLNLNRMSADQMVYFRAYVTYTDGSGAQHTVYTPGVYSICWNDVE